MSEKTMSGQTMIEQAENGGIMSNIMNKEGKNEKGMNIQADGNTEAAAAPAPAGDFYRKVCALIFTGSLLIGSFVCTICDSAITGRLTWSLIVTASVVLAWLVLCPVLRYGSKGVLPALILLSLVLIPYFHVLNRLISVSLLLPVSIRISVAGIIYLWMIYGLFRLMRTRRLIAGAMSLLLMIPLKIAIDFILNDLLGTSRWGIWDLFSYSVTALIAVLFFLLEWLIQINKKRS